MANLSNTYSWASNGTALLAFLSIDASEPEASVIEILFPSMLEIGDVYLGNWFTDDGTEDGTDEAHPASILIGLYELARSLVFTSDHPSGASAIKEGDVSVNYSAALLGLYVENGLPPSVLRWWFPYKKGILR